MKYKHLNKYERDKLMYLRGRGLKFREIAAMLGRSPGTLCRELKETVLAQIVILRIRLKKKQIKGRKKATRRKGLRLMP